MPRSYLFAALCAAALLIHVQSAAQAAIPSATTITETKLAREQNLGAAGNQIINFSVVLPYRHAAELSALIAAQSDPHSRYFRRFLKPSEFQAYFSADAASYGAATRELRRAGFTVRTFANRTVLDASGKTSDAASYFHTVIDRVRQVDGRLTYANVSRATIPQALAGAQVIGLSGIGERKTSAKLPLPASHVEALPPGVKPGPTGGFGPLAISKLQDYPREHGYLGKDSAVAIIHDGDVREPDVDEYVNYFGVHRTAPIIDRLVDGATCFSDCEDGYTVTADAQALTTIAPAATLLDYQMPYVSGFWIIAGMNQVVSDNIADIVDIRFGGCELDNVSIILAVQPIIAQGVAEGMTFTSPAEEVEFPGGSDPCQDGIKNPYFPADLDTVTSVGQSKVGVSRAGQVGGASEESYITNGGVSLVVPRPYWQANTRGTSPAGRNVPDISLISQINNVYPTTLYDGTWEYGGTSNEGDFVGYLASVREMYGGRLGNIAPALYASFNRFGYGSAAKGHLFQDVTSGCLLNTETGKLGEPCGKPGYDDASGIGLLADGFAVAKSFNFGPLAPPTRRSGP